MGSDPAYAQTVLDAICAGMKKGQHVLAYTGPTDDAPANITLSRAHSQDRARDGLEQMLKGGWMGGVDLFARLLGCRSEQGQTRLPGACAPARKALKDENAHCCSGSGASVQIQPLSRYLGRTPPEDSRWL